MPLPMKFREKFSHVHSSAKSPLLEEQPFEPSKSFLIEKQHPEASEPPLIKEQPREPAKPPAVTLLNLPLEIRCMIYTELGLSHNTFHLVQTASESLKAHHLRCTRHVRCTRPLGPSIRIPCPCLSTKTYFARSHRHHRWGLPYDSSAPLLLVCRQICIETVSMLYAQNTFDFGDNLFGDNLSGFTSFARDIGVHNRHTITDMRFSWPIGRGDYRPAGLTMFEAFLRTLREDMGPRSKLTILVNLASQSQHFDLEGLWAGEWWLEPLVRLGGAARIAGMELHVIVCAPGKTISDRVAWEEFQEDLQRLARRGQGVQSPWIRLERDFKGQMGGYLCMPGGLGVRAFT